MMSELLGKVMPMQDLLHMPLPFVHRLRDAKIRINQLRQEQMKQQTANQQRMGSRSPSGIPSFDPSTVEDLVDELSI